jgi:hypothetical protein
VWLLLMTRRGGGVCYVFNQGTGCPPPGIVARGPAFAGGLSIGMRRVLFFAEAKPAVTEIELRYQNGAREMLTPKDGFVLVEIPPLHYKPGTRLASAIGLNSAGRTLSRQNFQPQRPGVYPCKTPIARGYGITSCP